MLDRIFSILIHCNELCETCVVCSTTVVTIAGDVSISFLSGAFFRLLCSYAVTFPVGKLLRGGSVVVWK